MARLVGNVVHGLFDAAFRPERLVAVSDSTYGGSLLTQARQLRRLVTVYVVNLALYAGPLTVAGFGRQSVPSMPSGFASSLPIGSPEVLWVLGYGFVQNSLFILVGTILTFVSFHGALLLTFQSKGFLRSAYAVIYSTSAYLAGIYTMVWYLSMTPEARVARDLVLNLQKAFIYAIIDALQAPVELPGGRPQLADQAALSAQGSMVLTVLIVLVVYFFYSLYLGSRINHDTDRLVALMVIAAIGLTPVLYIVLSILAVTAVPS